MKPNKPTRPQQILTKEEAKEMAKLQFSMAIGNKVIDLQALLNFKLLLNTFLDNEVTAELIEYITTAVEQAEYAAKHSAHTYYTAQSGNVVKPALDRLIEAGDNIREVSINAEFFGLKPKTLRQMIYSGWDWLCIHEDHDGMYNRLRQRVMVSMTGDQVKLRTRRNLDLKDALVITDIDDSAVNDKGLPPIELITTVIARVADWMDNSYHGQQLELINLNLPISEVGAIRQLIAESEQRFVEIDMTTTKKVKLMNIDESRIKK